MTLKIKRIIFNTDSFICLITTLFLFYQTFQNTTLQNEKTYIILAILLLTLISTTILQLFYKKSLSSQIIFISVFITFLSLQGFRIIEPIIDFNSFLIQIQISKIALFCKYFSLLSLLGASLFSYSIKKQKIGSWLVLSIIASITISTIIHFNTGIIEDSLISKIIYDKEETVVSILISLIAAITFIKTGFDTKNREYFMLAVSTLLLSSGLILSFLSLSYFSGVFIILSISTGLIIFLRSVHNITLWG